MKKPLPMALLVIYSSENGRDNWKPVPPRDVPEWVQHPLNIAKLVKGEQCMKADEGDKGSLWYRAERIKSHERTAKRMLRDVERDAAKRQRRAQRIADRKAQRDATVH